MPKTAIFYVLSTDYAQEARRSAFSVWNAHPDNIDFPVFFFSSGPILDSRFDTFLMQRESQFWYVDSTRFLLSAAILLRDRGFERALYLDTDTFCCGSILELMRVLDEHDYAAAHAPGRRTRKNMIDVPNSFPEFNIGVNPFRLSIDVIGMLSDWYHYYEKGAPFWGNNDQASLREILWENKRGLRIATLPPEFNFRFGFGGFLRGECIFLHGRDPDLPSVANRVNAKMDFRSYRRGELG